MLPTFLKSSYSRYKDDTNSLAAWLLKAASICGYQPDHLTSTAPPLTSKGSKKKEKEKQANTCKNPVQYRITIKNLQVLADVVAKSSLTVPRSIIDTAKRAIKLRKEVTSWFLKKGDTEDNERHVHFVSALERVCETLESNASKSFKSDARQPSQASDSKDEDEDLSPFSNKFASLTVEEPKETHTSEQKHVPKSQKIVEVDVVENDVSDEEYSSELMFYKALFLFQDLQNMRKFISDTWLEYRDKKIDLMNAALVTDGVSNLAKILIQEVVEAWDACPLSVDLDIQEFFFTRSCFVRGVPLPTSFDFSCNKVSAKLADGCFMPTCLTLEASCDLLQERNLLKVKEDSFGAYNPKANREFMSQSQKSEEDRILLLKLISDVCMINAFDSKNPFLDSITEGLLGYVRTKKVNLWLCFASQIYLDIQHLMRHSASSAFNDLRMSGLRIKKTVDEYFKFSKTHSQPKFWSEGNDKRIEELKKAVDLVVDGDVFEGLCSKSSNRGPSEKHALLSRNPVMCGLSLFQLNARARYCGQEVVNAWYDVQSLAFLYNLVNVQSSNSLRWPDMETFIKIHGESHIFVGSRPKNACESLNRFELATGGSSVVRFARDARKRTQSRRDRKVLRLLKPTTTVAAILEAQYAKHPSERDPTRNIVKVLDKISQELSSNPTAIELHSFNPEVKCQNMWSPALNTDILEIFDLMKSRLAEEEPMILFNYLGMHQRCIEILRLIQAKENQEFLQCFDSEESYLQRCDGASIQNIALLVLQIARGIDESLKSLKCPHLVESDINSAYRLVMSCGEVMKEYLDRKGDVACKELRVFCKNKKPIWDAADHDKESEGLGVEEAMRPKTLASNAS
ncbi:hypothetical protein N7488_009567 [Penicillium malachiteum]|nr:hypothetical protein N7488_009567 [Penicillium malachiteum]